MCFFFCMCVSLLLQLPPVPDSALDLENILLHERCERLEFGTGDQGGIG